MEQTNLVSVIMPTYNCGSYIESSIQSVLEQTYQNWELWIVDDCSQDDTPRILEPYLQDRRIRYICLEENGGPAAARNRGLQLAQGTYIAFLDSDDLWMPDKLERQIRFMESEGCDFSCTAYLKINEAGESLHEMVVPPKRIGYWKTFFLCNPIGNSTVLYRRDAFGLVQIPTIRKRNDFAMWLQMFRGGAVCRGMETPLMRYRIRSGSVSSKKIALAKYHWQLYHHLEGHNWLISGMGMVCWFLVKGIGIGVDKRKTDL